MLHTAGAGFGLLACLPAAVALGFEALQGKWFIKYARSISQSFKLFSLVSGFILQTPHVMSETGWQFEGFENSFTTDHPVCGNSIYDIRPLFRTSSP